MPPKPSRRSSKTSIISIDPAVASHITSGARTTAHAGHARTESTPTWTTNAPSTAAVKGHGRTISAPNRNPNKRSNSLKRVKNSTEILKARSTAASRNTKPDDSSGVKRGRNFTVSNVATGGLLHLSPSPHQGPYSATVSSSPSPWSPTNIPPTSPLMTEAAPSSQPLHSRTRSVSPKRLVGRAILAKNSKDYGRVHHRSQSFSTVDESRRSIAASLQPRTLKIVINRPESDHSSEEEENVPSLQISIPHYKLGTPRFSAHGTPFLRGTSFTRVSGADSSIRSSISEGFSAPPPASLNSLSRIQRSQASDESVVPMPDPLRVIKPHQKRKSSSTLSYMAPISAELYNKLLAVYDDPAVVRYANSERDIAAATKIRIIAQISSESFMDYDLVSDFFLTFRSYMTTFEVLDYLLARLKWSIGRLSDDGRIIRIRTFAALRHWILNYFAEDFVVNRHLRVRFCQEVNEMYESVKKRPKGAAGVSDLKILQDLKRCWNGRCALYWDAEEFNMDSDQEEPLLPGGVLGSRNPAYADISEATAALGLGLQGMTESLPSPLPSGSTRTAKKTEHKRLPSSEYAKKPLSIQSAQSIQPTSCSLPRRQSKSPNKDTDKPSMGPQPVSVLSRRQNAPSDLKVHVHAKTESRSERPDTGQTEQQTPVEALMNSGHYVDPHAGSMIRGFVYGPVEPFIQLPVNPPLSPSVRFSAANSGNVVTRVPPSPHSPSHGPQNPAMKNIFGSIRRALSGKQGSNEVTLITVSSPRPSTSQTGRRAPVPMHLARSNDDLRRKAAPSPAKTQLRIDLLCAAAVQSFQTAVSGTQEHPSQGDDRHASPQAPQQNFFSPALGVSDESRDRPLTARMPSHYTARSGSILIVDDTAVTMPVMSGAIADSYTHFGSQLESHRLSPNFPGSTQRTSYETQMALNDNGTDGIRSHQDHSPRIGIARSPGLTVPLNSDGDKSRTASAITVRKLEASPVLHEQNVRSDEQPESLRSISPPSMTEATSKSESPISKAPAHGLRRRPGGDLRKNQNVHDLEAILHHQSLDSMLENSSNPDSFLIMGRPMTASSAGTPARKKKSQKVSMINTLSSQPLRPSFEAAVAGFSAIPDDNDGGLEATLLKLEGRYEDKSPDPSNVSISPTNRSFAASSEQPLSASTNPTEHEGSVRQVFRPSHEVFSADIPFVHEKTVDGKKGKAQSPRLVHRPVIFGLPTESVAASDSDESEISLPILKSNTSNGQATSKTNAGLSKEDSDDDEARSSSDILDPKQMNTVEIRPGTAHTDGAISFLLDEDENISDLSSEISVDIITYADTLGKPISPMLAAPGTAISGLEIPSHPLTHASLVNLSLQTSPNLGGSPNVAEQLLTPQQTPTLGRNVNGESATQNKQQVSANNQLGSVKQALTAGPAHVPFILACESDILAQQLTVVEQSALTEIEWTDLVEMRWTNDKSTSSLDWAEYMAKHDDARGIDVVTTRFNLVIKWVLSEIMLTQNIEERVRVISKLIHVAAHARRLHNYSTMLQIVIALMSTSCTRLKKTWAQVPGPDRSLLTQLEPLAQPLRNFHQLRLEMESTDLSSGCIPFLGLYVRDLTYNAQKPIEIHVGEDTEPLINFERFRTAAIIIKGLLRLIDASSRYDFEPIHGIIERCLWLSALSDDRIDGLSKSLE